MATRRDEADSVKKKEKATPAPRKRAAPAKKAAPRKTGAAASHEADANSAKGLLRAGLKALGNVRDDVVKHQTNVIESLLGIGKLGDANGGKSAAARAFPALDIGLRKFEDVFDQRVAAAMQRLGLPTAEEVQALREQVRLLLERIDQLERKEGNPPSARRKR